MTRLVLGVHRACGGGRHLLTPSATSLSAVRSGVLVVEGQNTSAPAATRRRVFTIGVVSRYHVRRDLWLGGNRRQP